MVPKITPHATAVHSATKHANGTGMRPKKAGSSRLTAHAIQILLAALALLESLSQNPAARLPLLKAELSGDAANLLI